MTEQKAQSNSANYDLVIVGGGMVGISLALLLAQQNHQWKILLLEAHSFQNSGSPSFDARSTASPGAAEKYLRLPDSGRHWKAGPVKLKKFMSAIAAIWG